MDLNETAHTLIKIGAILGIVLGLFSTLFWLYTVIVRMGLPLFLVNVYDLIMLFMSILAIGLCYFIFNRISQFLEADPTRTAIYLIILGIVVAIGALGIAGLLLILGAVLILIEETS